MLHYIYAGIMGLASVISIAFSSWMLHRIDLHDPSALSSPWWKTWQRAGLLTIVAFVSGLLGALLPPYEQHMIATVLFLFSCFILPFLYRQFGVGIKAYKIEQFAVWSAWLSATVFFGTNALYYSFFGLFIWIGCSIMGAHLIQNGFIKRNGA